MVKNIDISYIYNAYFENKKLMDNPLVSIIIPAFNSINFIKETIESALRQTYKNIEIILVDDGSTDGTEELFDQFKKEGIFCYRTDNIGASNARNFGLIKSKGTYIQYLDADDLIHPNKIESQLNAMLHSKAEISFSKWVNFENNIKQHRPFRFQHIQISKPKTGKELMISFGMNNWFVPVHSWLTQRSVIDKAGLWNVEIDNNDDGEFFSRVLYNSERVFCVDEILSYYRVLPNNSLSKLNSVNKINSAFKSYQLIESLLINDDNKELLSYPKRLYFIHFCLIRKKFPKFSKRAATAFDNLQVDCFLNQKKKYWILINSFGLYYGSLIYNIMLKVYIKIRK